MRIDDTSRFSGYEDAVLITPSPGSIDRAEMRLYYLRNRNRSTELFSMVGATAYYEQPIDLRLPIVFYEGHLPAFSFNKLIREALGRPSIDAQLERLFERGIDPDDAATASTLVQKTWPERRRVAEFAAGCDAAVLDAFANAAFDERTAQAAYTILEHEELHHETLLYLFHRLPLARKRAAGRTTNPIERPALASGRVAIEAGIATLGADRGDIAFGWDNEFGAMRIAVDAFEIDVNNVTNGEWLAYVKAGGPVPSFWIERDGAYFLLGQFAEIPLPLTWPVYVTQQQAAAYAAWRGSRLPTEAEYHRAAFGVPGGGERAFPWGDEAPTSKHGNFDFRRYDPESVGIHDAGKSAWGVYDLIGNGWEWTSTEFAPLPGFEPMASYPQYSADFFDGKHFVVLGASPVTSRSLVRRSFRNWYRGDYPYVYATFRTVA
jgi:formylglycine-generating enzyme required for sulfatase activity